jgi:hypothetical protein
VPFVRRAPMTAAFCAILLVVLAVPSAAHSWTAAGGSPLRHLVAVVPLLLLPLAAHLSRLPAVTVRCASPSVEAVHRSRMHAVRVVRARPFDV